MPLDEKILGFSNRWYKAAMKSSTTKKISADLEIQIVTGPFFIATKLEAFRGRGKGDFLESHDLICLVIEQLKRRNLDLENGILTTSTTKPFGPFSCVVETQKWTCSTR